MSAARYTEWAEQLGRAFAFAAECERTLALAEQQPVAGDLAPRYADLLEALQQRLVLEHDVLAELEAATSVKDGLAQEDGGRLELVFLRYEDIERDAKTLLRAAGLLGTGPLTLSTWRQEAEDALISPEMMQPALDQAVRAAWRGNAAAPDPAAGEVPERARAAAHALRASKDLASRALDAAAARLAQAQPAPAAAVDFLAQAQRMLSNTLDDAFDDVFLAALGAQRPEDRKPSWLAFKARAQREAAKQRRREYLLSFDRFIVEHPGHAAAADFLDPDADAGVTLDPVAPAAMRAWWESLPEARS